MKKFASIRTLLFAMILPIFAGCMSVPTFVQSVNPAWTTIEVRTDVPYDASWDRVVDYLIKRYDMELLSRPDGYLRTHWLYTWTGEFDKNYRVKVAVKFAPDRKALEIKTEAESGGEGNWTPGYDTRLRDTIGNDLTTLVSPPKKP